MEEETSGDYSGAISKMAIGKMCAALGFKQIQQGALESLADIAKEYIGTLGRNIVNISETGGRAIPGVHDAITALEDTVIEILKTLAPNCS